MALDNRPHKIQRSKEEIEQMLKGVRLALTRTPDYNAFDESNAEAIAEMRRDIAVLEAALEGRYVDEAHNDEVGYWLSLPESDKHKSMLYDYLDYL